MRYWRLHSRRRRSFILNFLFRRICWDKWQSLMRRSEILWFWLEADKRWDEITPIRCELLGNPLCDYRGRNCFTRLTCYSDVYTNELICLWLKKESPWKNWSLMKRVGNLRFCCIVYGQFLRLSSLRSFWIRVGYVNLVGSRHSFDFLRWICFWIRLDHHYRQSQILANNMNASKLCDLNTSSDFVIICHGFPAFISLHREYHHWV